MVAVNSVNKRLELDEWGPALAGMPLGGWNR